MSVLSNKRIMFIAKSLLWSALLYLVCMLIINWNETTGSNKKQNDSLPVVNTAQQIPYPGGVDVHVILPLTL